MNTTKTERREAAEAHRNFPACLVMRLIADANRCEELEAQISHVRRWAGLQAGLSRVPIEEIRAMIGTLDSPLWNRHSAT